MTELVFEHLGPEGVRAGEQMISRVYTTTHADVIDDPFYSPERFTERVHAYSRSPGFELVIGYIDGNPVGLALGFALPVNSRWWRGLTTPIEPEFIAEDGTRTFALNEILTDPDWQGQGVAHQVHDELLNNRTERRATLLVREDNEKARAAYFKWGWRKIGKIRPFADSPHYDALILDLIKD